MIKVKSTMDLEAFDIKACTLNKFVPAKATVPTLEITFEHFNENIFHAQQKCLELTYPFARSILKTCPLIAANVLVEGSNDITGESKRVIEVNIDIKNFSEIKYEPGDTIGILPINSDEDVALLVSAMKVESIADTVCNFKMKENCSNKAAKLPPYIPKNTTIREILRDCLNFKSVPKKQFLRALGESCLVEAERNFLCCLSSKEGSQIYTNLILEKGLNLIDLLRLCPSCIPPIELCIEHLPRLLPRPYSVANSPLRSKNELRLIFSVKERNPGIATHMLQKKIESLRKEIPENPSKIILYFREANKFRYTSSDVVLNQILISIGTGVAPFVGFLEQKEHLVYLGESTTSFGQTWLFAGAKSPDHLPYRKYFKELKQEGAILDKYYECFSKYSADTTEHQYVQDLIKAHAQDFVNFLLLPQTILYVCADGNKISKSIESTIVDCLKDILKIELGKALEMVKTFRSIDKYREDLWT